MENDTTTMAESALHQMVICGYALIGHDPSHAVKEVIILKNMIKDSLKPIYKNKEEIYTLLKACGHDHDSLKKVIKCVISKSPVLKSVMMQVTSKMLEGVVTLTKLMAHAAMHEACLIEVVNSITDKTLVYMKSLRTCVFSNNTAVIQRSSDNIIDEDLVEKYMTENNATVLDLPKGNDKNIDEIKEDINSDELTRRKEKVGEGSVDKIDEAIKDMLKDKSALDKRSKKKLIKMRRQLKEFEKKIQANKKEKS